jgi:hypothetical protein
MHETGQELGDPEQAERWPEAKGLGEGAGKKKPKGVRASFRIFGC